MQLKAPASRIGILSPQEITEVTNQSALVSKYNQSIDRESAYEILNEKLSEAAGEEVEEEKPKKTSKPEKEEKSIIEKMSENTMVRQVGRTVVREVARGLLGVLGLGGTSKRKKKSGWF